MNKIGFINFRRFQEFAPLEYGGITFLVGRNNSGKTTLVKALLLLDHYLKSKDPRIFSFGNNILEDANIVTYGRAKNQYSREDFISFVQQIENYTISIILNGKENDTYAKVLSLLIKDEGKGLEFKFDFQSETVSITKTVSKEEIEEQDNPAEEIKNQIRELQDQIHSSAHKKTSKEYIALTDKLGSLEKKLDDIEKDESPKMGNILFCLEGNMKKSESLLYIVEGLVNRSMAQYDKEFKNISEGEEPSEKFEQLRALKEYDPVFVVSSFSHFTTLMDDFSIAYMGANPAKQSALFAIRDKNNALAQAINDFKQLNIQDGEKEHRFVEKWMKEFDVGDAFKIEMYGGEAYELKILSRTKWVHLADKGMGSIQAMLLILRIACVMRKIRLAEKDESNYRIISETTIVIEEPELNLHPKLQSRLADLFFDVHQSFEYKINFLVETHSEYIIRRTQVLVAENELEVKPNENPFKIYYFSSGEKELPYQIEYEQDGTLKRNFDEGFFDEASRSTLKLLKLKREKN